MGQTEKETNVFPSRRYDDARLLRAAEHVREAGIDRTYHHGSIQSFEIPGNFSAQSRFTKNMYMYPVS